MVFYKPRVQTGARRVGQAQQAQSPMLQQQDMNPNQVHAQTTLLPPALVQTDQDILSPQSNALLNAAGTELYSDRNDLNQLQEATGFRLAAGKTAEGGADFLIRSGNTIINVEEIPQVQVQPPAEAQCEFPAQDVDLQRNINITNSTPQLQNVDTDICGNVVGYTETMTRHLSAGPWIPISGLQGRVDNINDVNGVLQSNTFNQNVVYANSPGINYVQPVQPNVVSQQLVGGKRPSVGGKRPSVGGSNAAFGYHSMRTFRSK